jgi:hypothetical protein
MNTVLSKASKKDVVTAPFPYIVIENALDNDVCDALIREFPHDDVIRQGKGPGNNQRFSLSAPSVQGNENISPLWKEFISLHTSKVLIEQFASLFEDQISAHFPHFDQQFGQLKEIQPGVRNKDTFDSSKVLVDAQICINTPVIDAPTSVKIAHIDDVDKLYAGLYYLRHPDDDSVGGDLQVYKTRKGNYKIHGQRLVEDRYVEVVQTIPYKKNTLVIFLNTPDALHGVTVRQATPHTRKFVNLIAEMNQPLFSLEDHQENIFDKVRRKLAPTL